MAAQLGYATGASQRGKGHEALADLTRTLEALETRLDRVTRGKPRAVPDAREKMADLLGRSQNLAKAAARNVSKRPDLADTVSQIVIRQKDLEQQTDAAQREGTLPKDWMAPRPQRVTSRPGRLVDAADGDNVDELKSELQRLREELTRNLTAGFSLRIEEMRGMLADLQHAVSQGARPSLVLQEIARLHDRLDEMARDGLEPRIVDGMRAELDDLHTLIASRYEARGRADAERNSAESAYDRAELRADIEHLRQSVSRLASEDQVSAIEHRWAVFEERFASELGSQERVNELSGRMLSDMAGLRTQLAELLARESEADTPDGWSAIEARIAQSHESFAKIEDRLSRLEESLGALPETIFLGAFDKRLESLAEAVEAISRQQVSGDYDADRLDRIEAQLDHVAQSLAAFTSQPIAIDLEPIQRIEARMQALADQVGEIASDDAVANLAANLRELTTRIDSLADQEPNRELVERISSIDARLGELAEQQSGSREDVAALEERLVAFAQRIEEQIARPFEDGEAIVGLETQIGRLTEILSSDGFAVSADVERRVGDLERQMAENEERIFATAKQAADEAVRQIIDQGDFGQGEHVARLTEELEKLQQLSSDNSLRSGEFYDAVNAALNRLVQRIDAIERDYDRPQVAEPTSPIHADEIAETNHIPSATFVGTAVSDEPKADDGETEPATASATPTGLRGLIARTLRRKNKTSHPVAPAPISRWDFEETDVRDETTPSPDMIESGDRPAERIEPTIDPVDALESEEADRPLAIGSGQPDIAALLERVRNQKGATQATAPEAAKADFIAAARRAAMAAARETEARDARSEDDVEGSFDRRRRPLTLAASAVLLALLALPVGKAIVERTDLFDAPWEEASSKAEPAEAISETRVAESASAPASSPAPASEPAPDEIASTTPDTQTASTSDTDEPSGVAVSDEIAREVARNDAATIREDAQSAPEIGALSTTTFAPRTSEPAIGPTLASTRTDLPDDVSALPEGIGSTALLDAARGGDSKALFEIGLRFMEGQRIAPDATKASEWFRRSADLGFAPAQYSLGTLYEKGNGVSRDTVAARDWYLKAADNGNVRAMHNLAVLFATGVDGQSEPEEAAKWFVEAAEHGMTDSQYNLGILFARGAGVEQDLGQSYKWFSIVGESGDEDAKAKRDEIAKAMSPEQLEAAKSEVASFEAKDSPQIANIVEIPDAWNDLPASKPVPTASVDMERAVRNIQVILGRLGYDAGLPDGIVGERTTKAIERFQADAGLPENGEIDEALIRALLDRKDDPA